MPSHSLDRSAAVAQLLTHVLESIGDPAESEWLRHILQRGFVGFERMSDAQLRRELELRELSVPEEPDEDFMNEEDEHLSEAALAIGHEHDGRTVNRDFD